MHFSATAAQLVCPQVTLADALILLILSSTMLGTEAGEVMAVVQAAMLAGIAYTGLRDPIINLPDNGGEPRSALLNGSAR